MPRPNLIYLKNFILVLLGGAFGFLVSFLGIGLTIIAVPIVAILLGFRFAKASASAAAVTLFAAGASLPYYYMSHHINLMAVFAIILGQRVGALLASKIDGGFSLAIKFNIVVGTILALLGLAMVTAAGGYWNHIAAAFSGPWHTSHYSVAGLAAILIIGMFAGLLSRVFAVTGLLIVPSLELIMWSSPLEAQGTALLVLAIDSLLMCIVWAKRDCIDRGATQWMAGGAVFGGLTGAMCANTLAHPVVLMSMYGAALVVLGSVKILQLGKSRIDISVP